MTRKERSKVRTQTTPEPAALPIDELIADGTLRVSGPAPLSADAVAEAYGFKPGRGGDGVVRITPAEFVELYPQVMHEFSPAELVATLDGQAVAAGVALYSPPDHDGTEGGNPLRNPGSTLEMDAPGTWGRYRLVPGKPPTEESDDEPPTSPGVAARDPGSVPILWLGPLWVDRLQKMAERAGVTPQQYLDRLLARAWSGMPRRSRVGE
jgi:hypothetical protein